MASSDYRLPVPDCAYPTKPSCGQSCDEMSNGVTDLSDLANTDFPAYQSSMIGGNTVTEKDTYLQMGAPGSQSEGTADVPVHNHPGLDVPSTQNFTRTEH